MSDLHQGVLVRFANEKDGGPVHRIVSVMQDGMVELHDMGGYFAPHLFEVADDVGGIPCDDEPCTDCDGTGITYQTERQCACTPTQSKIDLLPCPFCGGEAERIDIEDGDNAGGSCIHCTRCDACSNVEFEFKEHFISNWNRRALPNAVEVLTRAVRDYLIDCDDQGAPVEAFADHRSKMRSAIAAINI